MNSAKASPASFSLADFFKPSDGSNFFNVEFFLTKVYVTLLSTASENQYWHLYREFKANFDPDTAQC